jgi:uncharacterized protein YidB (DUF937 family)
MALLDIFGGSHRGGMSPITLALIGVLAYRTMHGKGRLAEMLGTAQNNNPAAGSGAAGSIGPSTGTNPMGNLGRLLSGVLGGGALSGGLQDLVNQFRQNGLGQKAESWISGGPNHPVSPQELEQALGSDRVDWLVHQTGMPRDQLLSGLSGALPGVVDKLTPNGRVPTEQEAAAMHGGSAAPPPAA